MAFVLRFLSINLSVYEMLYKACVASAKVGDLPGSDPFSMAPSIIANCRRGTWTISTFFGGRLIQVLEFLFEIQCFHVMFLLDSRYLV